MRISFAFAALVLPLASVFGASPQTQPVSLGTPQFAGIVGDGQVVGFSWWSVKGAVGGYQLLRAANPQAVPTTIAAVPSGTLGARDTQPATTGMYYQLVAIGANGTQSATAWTLVNTPQITDVSSSGPNAVIGWSTLQPAPAGCEIWRTTDPAKPSSRVGVVPSGVRTFTDKQAAGGTYYYQVVALGMGGRAASAWYPYNLPASARPALAAVPSSPASAPPPSAVTSGQPNGLAPVARSPLVTASSSLPPVAGSPPTPAAPTPPAKVGGASSASCGLPAAPIAHTGNPPEGLFIDPAVMMTGVCSPNASSTQCTTALATESLRYYQSIGVIDPSFDVAQPNLNGYDLERHLTPERGSFESWLQYWGFGADNRQPVADELRALYFNNGDLQLGRDMHCRVQKFYQGANIGLPVAIGYACYVLNSNNSRHPGPLADPVFKSYAASEEGGTFCDKPNNTYSGRWCFPTDPVASITSRPWTDEFNIGAVAMEVTARRSAKGAGSARWIFGDVAFIVYGSSHLPNAAAFALDSESLPSLPALFSKTVPGVCMACHGGTYQASTSTSPARISGANFLPFDTANYIYRNDNAAITETAQREVFRKLNAFVQSTQPPQQTVTDLISGWYAWCGGVSVPGCYMDNVGHPFVPGDPSLCSNAAFCSVTCSASRPAAEQTCGWASGQPVNGAGKPGFDMRAFYTEVVGPLCRTCHVALPDRFNVQNLDEWKARAFDPVETSHTMPFAEVPYLKYSGNSKGRSGMGAKDFFRYFFSSARAADLRKECLAKCDSDQSCCTNACYANCKGPRCATDLGVQTCLNQCAATRSQCPSSCPSM